MRSLDVDFRIQEGFEGVEKERGRGGGRERMCVYSGIRLRTHCSCAECLVADPSFVFKNSQELN